jgi:hypothetical protein
MVGSLFNFAFFVHDVLTDDRVKFFDLHFFRHRFLVFGGGVKVTCAFAGNKFDFIAHGFVLLSYSAVFTQICQYSIYAFFVDDSHTFGRNPQTHPTVFTFHPKPMMLEIREKTSFGSVIRV